jgi:hypothetical protein
MSKHRMELFSDAVFAIKSHDVRWFTEEFDTGDLNEAKALQGACGIGNWNCL